ncbi:MAG: hypothetical protein ACXWPM_01820 [Bdellovibrionota bacterium]
MIQVGVPAMIGATFDSAALRVAARVFDVNGPVGGWIPLVSYDGNSYHATYTYTVAGAFSVKKVVFIDADVDYTQRDENEPELEEEIQVVDLGDILRAATGPSGNIVGEIETLPEIQGVIESLPEIQ